MIILRAIHILSGVMWVGFGFFNIAFLQPTVRATGAGGQNVTQHLAQRTRLATVANTAAALNVFSGLLMYVMLSRLQWSFVTTGYGLLLTLGGIAGLLAWIIVIIVTRGSVGRMQVLGRAMGAQQLTPTPEQTAAMQVLSARLAWAGIYVLALMIAVLGMSVAQYVSF